MSQANEQSRRRWAFLKPISILLALGAILGLAVAVTVVVQAIFGVGPAIAVGLLFLYGLYLLPD